MKFFKPKKQFDKDTGREIAPRMVLAGYICDYTGEIIEGDTPLYSVEFEDLTGSEAYWYYDEHPVIKQLTDALGDEDADFIVRSHLNVSKFHFKGDECGNDASISLMIEWTQNVHIKNHLFYQCPNLAKACALARYRTVQRLLEHQKITVANLDISSVGML